MSKINYSKNINRKFETGKPGAPPKYRNAKELQAECDAYFSECNENDEPYLIGGLALYLGFNNRSSLRDYERRNDGFSRVVKRAIQRVGLPHESLLSKQPAPGASVNVVGPIFWLKNHGFDSEQNTTVRHVEGYEIDIPNPAKQQNDAPNEN